MLTGVAPRFTRFTHITRLTERLCPPKYRARTARPAGIAVREVSNTLLKYRRIALVEREIPMVSAMVNYARGVDPCPSITSIGAYQQ